MANTVFKLRRSSVSGKWPNTSTLAIGELAINLTDRKLFSTDGSHVFEIGSNVGSISTGNLNSNSIYVNFLDVVNNAIIEDIEILGRLKVGNSFGNSGLYLATNGSSVYWSNPSQTIDIPHINQSEISNGVKTEYAITGGYEANNLSVYVNGVRLTSAEANISSGSNVSFAIAPSNGAIIDFFGYKLDAIEGEYVNYSTTGDGTTNTFPISGGFDSNRLNVFLNGVRAANSEIDISSGNSIIFNIPPALGVNIDAFGIKNLNPLASYVSDVFTGDGVTTVFNSSGQYLSNRLSVYLNGVRMSSAEANTASGTSIIFSSAPANGSIIETYGIYVAPEIYQANADVSYLWTNTHYWGSQADGAVVNSSAIAVGNSSVNVYINSTAVYISGAPIGAGGVSLDAKYTWTNTHTFGNSTVNSTVNSTLISIGNSSVNTQIVAGNVYLNGSTLLIGNSTVNVVVNSSSIVVGGNNINATSFSGTANNTEYVGFIPAANVVSNAQLQANVTTLQTYADNKSANAYSNSVSYTDTKIGTVNSAITSNASTAYSNAVSTASADATSKASTAYSNAVSYMDTKIATANSAISGNAATAYSNSVSYVDAKIGTANAAITGNAATAYSNAVSVASSDANSKAFTAYSNATAYTDIKIATANLAITGNAATAYSNAVSTASADATSKAEIVYSNAASYTDSKVAAAITTANAAITGNAATAYTNSTIFASNASNINTGTLAEARLPYRMDQNVRTTDNITVGNMTITGNLYVGSNVTVIGANNLSLVDNMIYLNANNTVTNPDLGFAGNYNDGTYQHAGFFRDASDGIWKVYDSYLPEPDANAYIDTTNTTFHIANFQANTLYLGNTSTNWIVGNTSGIFAGATLIGNSTGPYGKAESSLSVATANNSTYAFGKNEINLNVNNALTSNNSSYLGGTAASDYQTTAGLSANVAKLSSNNSTYFGGALSNTFIRNSSLVQYFNPFIPSNTINKYYSSITTNRFLGRAAQLYVTVDNIEDNSIAQKICDGGFESQHTLGVAGGAAVVVNINTVTNGMTTSAGFVYSSGEVDVFFYPGRGPSNFTARFKNKDGVWSNATVTPIVYYAADPIGYRLTGIPGNYMTDIELTLTPQSTVNIWLTEVEYHGNRMGLNEGPFVTVGGATFYGNINQTANIAISNTGKLIFAANSGIVANGDYGAAGHVLHSNGSSVYWAADDQGVTSVGSGNGLTGGAITTTGTISVLANNGITANVTGLYVTQGTGTVVNATGVHVNSTYIGTLSSNNTTYVNGKTEGNLNVNNALTSNNSSYLGGTIASGYQTTAGLSANVATLTSNNSTFSYGKTEGNLNVNNALTSNNSSHLGGVAAASYALLSGATFTGNVSGTNISLTGNISAATITETSSIAYKENVTPLNVPLDAIDFLEAVTYDRIGSKKQTKEIGMIAEEVYAVLPELVSLDENGKPFGIHYTKLSVYLLEVVKDLKNEIKKLKGE